MTVTIEKLKQYLRIDSDYEDELLQDFLNTANSYLQGAISNFNFNYKYEDFANKADILQMTIAAELYQNRDSRNDPRKDYSFAIRTMINQLQYFVVNSIDTDTVIVGGEPP